VTDRTDIELKREISEYAMAFDLLTKVTHSITEKEAIENILQICSTLFSPQKLFFASIKDNKPEQIYSLLLLTEDKSTIKTRLTNFNKKYDWTESKKGFQIIINYQGNTLGILEVDELACPEYKEHYLNLTISMVDVFGLSIENAMRYQRIKAAEKEAMQKNVKLEKAMAEIKKLSGLLPICMHCKKIRDDKGYWSSLEGYIQENSEAEFSHSICRECAEEHYPGIDIYDE